MVESAAVFFDALWETQEQGRNPPDYVMAKHRTGWQDLS